MKNKVNTKVVIIIVIIAVVVALAIFLARKNFNKKRVYSSLSGCERYFSVYSRL